MQYASKIRILSNIVAYTFFNVRLVQANPNNNLPVVVPNHSVPIQKESLNAIPHTVKTSPEEDTQIPDEVLPLVKVAHSNVMDLLYRFFITKPIDLPIYTPFVQHVGVKINWFECLKNFWPNKQKSYAGGVDIHFSGPLQLSIDLGYLGDYPTNIAYGNQLNYSLKGSYGLGALLYIMHPNRLTNAYLGVGYGCSRFDLITFYSNVPPLSKPFVAGWIKLIAGSELNLVSQLYGGMQLAIAYLLHGKKNDDARVSVYTIPGYGKIVNKIVLDITLYLKWSISFLEKKIVF